MNPDGEKRLRLFVALETPEAVREALRPVLAGLKQTGADVRWEQEAKLHATIKFLGDTIASRVQPVVRALEQAASVTPPLQVRYSGLGFFPSAREPRIVWAGIVDGSGLLGPFHALLEQSLGALGYPVESRDFHPHVTLGRVRSRRGSVALRSRMETSTFDVPSTLHEVALVRSDLRPTGSVYTTLNRIFLSAIQGSGQ
jgi:2'-5' RNA ligase